MPKKYSFVIIYNLVVRCRGEESWTCESRFSTVDVVLPAENIAQIILRNIFDDNFWPGIKQVYLNADWTLSHLHDYIFHYDFVNYHYFLNFGVEIALILPIILIILTSNLIIWTTTRTVKGTISSLSAIMINPK